jgi:hypothetical protein
MRRAFAIIHSIACLSALATAAGATETLHAPAQVMAQLDGSFSYSVWLRKGPGTAQFGGYGYVGTANVEGAGIADGFCISTVEPGEVLSFEIFGRLLNTTLPGDVHANLYFCDAPGDEAMTHIIPWSTTGVGDRPVRAVLWNEPNPFATRTTFHYVLTEAADVSLSVHDVAGRLVDRVEEGAKPAGEHRISWSPRADVARSIRGGILFARLRAGGLHLSRRLILLR